MSFLEKFIPSALKKESGKREGYNFKEMKAIEESSVSLIASMKEAIDSEKYDVLIGDDASGRIPTLTIWNVMKERMREKHPDWSPEMQRKALQTYFVAGGQDNPNSAELKDYFSKVKERADKRVLLITEYIESGQSIFRLGKMLEDLEIPFDIATLQFSTEGDDREQEVRDFLIRHKIYIGDISYSEGAPAIYGKTTLSGVFKVTDPEINPSMMAHSIPAKVDPLDLTKAREDMKQISDKALTTVWGK